MGKNVVPSAPPAWKKRSWTPSEDALLLAYVRNHGECNWNTAHLLYPDLQRSGKSCRQRYRYQLREGLRKGRFSPAEERVTLRAVTKYGNQWSKIAELLPGRTDNGVKNFWNVRLKRLKRQRPRASNQLNAPLLQCTQALHAFVPFSAYPSPTSRSDSAAQYWSSYGLMGNQKEAAPALINAAFVKENSDLMASLLCDHYQNAPSDPFALPSVQTTSKPLGSCSYVSDLAGQPPPTSSAPPWSYPSSFSSDKDLLEANIVFSPGASSYPKPYQLSRGDSLLEGFHNICLPPSYSDYTPSVHCVGQTFSLPVVNNVEHEAAPYMNDILDSEVVSTSTWNHMPGAYDMADSPVSVLNPDVYY